MWESQKVERIFNRTQLILPLLCWKDNNKWRLSILKSYILYILFIGLRKIIISMISEQKLTEKPQIHLQIPQVMDCRLEAVYAKIRPYRQNGVRLQHQQIADKHVFHNYGHGSSGIALAYGSAFMSVKSLSTFLKKEDVHSCAVLGSGLIGLLTANELAKKGLKVTVYSKNTLEKNGKSLTCQKNDGLFLPFGYDSTNRLNFELLSKLSYEYYNECIKAFRYQSFRKAQVFDRNRSREQLKRVIPPFLYNSYKQTQIVYQNGKSEKFTKLKTFKIDLPLFLQQLKVEAQLRGVTFAQKMFNSQTDVLSLQQKCIFNCTGYGSSKLFADPSLKAYIENVIVLTNPKKIDYMLICEFQQKMRARIACEGNKIIIRSQNLVEAGQISKQLPKLLLEQAYKFFVQRSQNIQAKL